MTISFLVEKILMPDSREIELSGDVAVISEVGNACMTKHLWLLHVLIYFEKQWGRSICATELNGIWTH